MSNAGSQWFTPSGFYTYVSNNTVNTQMKKRRTKYLYEPQGLSLFRAKALVLALLTVISIHTLIRTVHVRT